MVDMYSLATCSQPTMLSTATGCLPCTGTAWHISMQSAGFAWRVTHAQHRRGL